MVTGKVFQVFDGNRLIIHNYDLQNTEHAKARSEGKSTLDVGEDWDTHAAIRMLLRRYGFTFHQCPYAKKHYRLIAKRFHTGRFKDAWFDSKLNGNTLEIHLLSGSTEEEARRDKYDRAKERPYLTRLRLRHVLGLVRNLLIKRGFEERFGFDDCASATDKVKHRREKTGHRDYWNRMDASNITDQEGVLLKEGDLRYCYLRGRLVRGHVSFGLNSCHDLVANDSEVSFNIHVKSLFSWKPGTPRRRVLSPAELRTKLADVKAVAVKNENYERAIVLRDLIQRLNQS